MDKQLVAKASITIDAPVARVWEALTKPEGNDAGEFEEAIGIECSKLTLEFQPGR